MTQEELNEALYMACGRDNDVAHAEELIGRGADQHALVAAGWNALHWAGLVHFTLCMMIHTALSIMHLLNDPWRSEKQTRLGESCWA